MNTWEVKELPKEMQGKTVQDFLYNEGMFNPILRFAFTNVTDEPFLSHWNSRPYTVAPHTTVKLTHHLARKFTKELVDALMTKDKKGLLMAVPAQRKSYEDKVLALLPPETGNDLEIIKSEFIEQLEQATQRVEGEPDALSPSEKVELDFDDLRNRTVISKAQSEPEATIEPVKKAGRPRKNQ